MTDADNPQEDAGKVRQDAWDWVLRITSGHATRADVAALESWCAQSPQHAQEYARASARWRSVGPVVESIAQQDGMALAGRRAPASSAIGRRALLGGAVAASAAGAAFAIVRPPLGLWPSARELAAGYRTATGERRQIALADAVSVEMNTRTSLNVRRAAGNGDSIELISGEAIVATRSRAIEVIAGNGRASADTAQFNIRYDGPNICVTCVEGLVQVEQQGRSVSVSRNQQLTYASQSSASLDFGQMTTVDPAVVTGWRDGDLYFQNEPLSRVIEEVNRYRPGHIILTNETLGQRRFTASFKLDRLEVVVTQLQAAFGARVTSLPGGIVLLS